MGKNSPLSRSCSLSALRVIPGSTMQSRSSPCTANTLFMSRKSRDTPPTAALTWPSVEGPPDAEWNNGDTTRRANAHDLLHFFGVLRIDNSIRRLVSNPGDCIAVLFTHRLRCHHAVAKSSSELGDYFSDCRRISGFLF